MLRENLFQVSILILLFLLSDYNYFDYDTDSPFQDIDQTTGQEYKEPVTIGGSTRYENSEKRKNKKTFERYGHGIPLGFDKHGFDFDSNIPDIFMNDIKKINRNVVKNANKYNSFPTNNPYKKATANVTGFKNMDELFDQELTPMEDRYFDTRSEEDFYTPEPTLQPNSINDLSDNPIFPNFKDGFFSEENDSNYMDGFGKAKEEDIVIPGTIRKIKKPPVRPIIPRRNNIIRKPKPYTPTPVRSPKPRKPDLEYQEFSEFKIVHKDDNKSNEEFDSYHKTPVNNRIQTRTTTTTTTPSPTIKTYIVTLKETEKPRILKPRPKKPMPVRVQNNYETNHNMNTNKPTYTKTFKPSAESKHRVIDPSTGLPFAQNEGFDPKTVVFEKDFQPLGTLGLVQPPEQVMKEYVSTPVHSQSSHFKVVSAGEPVVRAYQTEAAPRIIYEETEAAPRIIYEETEADPRIIYEEVLQEPVRPIIVRSDGPIGDHYPVTSYDIFDPPLRTPSVRLRPPPESVHFPFRRRFPRELNVADTPKIRKKRSNTYNPSEALRSLSVFKNAPIPNLERSKLLAKYHRPLVRNSLLRRHYRDFLRTVKSKTDRNLISMNERVRTPPKFKDDHNTYSKWKPIRTSMPLRKRKMKVTQSRLPSTNLAKNIEWTPPFSDKDIKGFIDNFNKKLSQLKRYKLIDNTKDKFVEYGKKSPASAATNSAYVAILKDVWNNLTKKSYHFPE